MRRILFVTLVAVVWSCGVMPSRPDAGAAGGRASGGGTTGGGTTGGGSAGGAAGGSTSGGTAGGANAAGGVAGGIATAGGAAGGGATAGGVAGGGAAAGGAAGGDAGGSAAGGAAGGSSSDGGMGDAESCASAGDLRLASTTTPAAGYTGRIVDSMGQVNDYSPLTSDPEPPNCSVVYPAPGLDRVYRVTLQPAQRLELRLALTPGTAQPGLYVLDNCATPTIRDVDNSGACGLSEYNVGFCPVVPPCANSVLSYTNALTAPAEVFVVVDQVANSNASGFTLDWRTVP